MGKATGDTGPADGALLARQIADALALFIGPERRFSREMIAAATGLDPRTIKGHCLGETVPNVAALFAYFRVLPVAFADHVLARAGLTGARRIEGEADPRRAMAIIAEGVAVLASALADGRIDHMERRNVIAELRATATAAEELAAKLENVK